MLGTKHVETIKWGLFIQYLRQTEKLIRQNKIPDRLEYTDFKLNATGCEHEHYHYKNIGLTS